MPEELVCRACGQAVGRRDRFCSACGGRVDHDRDGEERKLVSAVVVDLVGYTGLSAARDPEETRLLLEEYWRDVRRELERYGGTVEKFIGDAVVGIFGAPAAHDDDALRAVSAAIAIRDAARGPGRPRVRAAVATGVALVHVSARPETGEALVVGDVVTLASRLQEGAPRGAVLVDEPTRAATREGVAYRRVPPVVAKGRREPIPAWRAVGLRRRHRVRDGARFVGRRPELALLETLLARVRAERSVQLVTVVGEPGIGKSRLLRELELGDAQRWEARALPYGESGAFSPLAQIMRERAGVRESDDEAGAASRLAKLLVSLLPDAAERRVVEPAVRRLLGLDAPAAAPAEGLLESFAAWRRLVEAAAAERPLVLVLEDAHWADDALLDFVEHLVEWARDVPLLVLCTARPDLLRRRSGWSGGTSNSLTLSLAPLSDEDTASIVTDVLGRPPAPAERADLVARAGGNPLYAEQLAHMVGERAEPANGVPETVHAVIAARIDRLPPSAKRLLLDAAVVGLDFAPELLTPLGRHELEAGLHELERMGLVGRRGGEGAWAFRHRLVREVAYAQLPHAARAEKHRLVAEWLEQRQRGEDAAEAVAYHWVRAREEGASTPELDARVRAALVRAADRALELNAFASAAQHSAQALELWPADAPGRAERLLRYAHALWSAEVSGEAFALEARDGLLAAGDPDGAAGAEALLSEIRWYRGDRAAALAHLEAAVALVAGRPPSRAKALVLARLARSQMLAAAYEDAIRSGGEARALAHELGLAELEAEALNSIGSARVRSGDAGGVEELRRATELAAGTRAAVVAYNNLGTVLLEAGDRAGSRDAIERGRALAARLGDRLHLDWFEAEETSRLLADDRWDEALAVADARLAGPRLTAYASIGVRGVRGLMLHARGRGAEALADLAQASHDARAAGDPQTLVPTLAAEAFVLLAEGRADAARACAVEALDVCERAGDVPPLAAVDLALACVAAGLRERLGRALDGARGRSRWLDVARLYVDGETERALALLDGTDSRWHAAYVRLQLGGAHLGEARAYYRGVGATAYERRCDELSDRRGTPDGVSVAARMGAAEAGRKVPA